MSDKQYRKKKDRNAVQRPNKTILSRTLILMTVCGVVAFVVLAVKLYQIQIMDHDKYERLAVEQQTRESKVTAARGTIFDVNGKPLAMSASVETVYISPKEIEVYNEDKELIASNLAALLDVDKDKILAKMEDTNSWYKTIKPKIEKELADKVRQLIKDNKLKSVHLEPDSKRYYPNSSLASHVLGFVGSENQGLNGLEIQYNCYMQGTEGRIVRLKNARGTDMLFTDFENYYDAKNGNDVTLTIDATIQYYVEKYLAQAIEDYDVQNGGICLAMNPKTGELYALASFGDDGSFDPNNYASLSPDVLAELGEITDEEERKKAASDALNAMWRDKAISDTYEPGSVFKIITCATALEENVIDLNSTFYCGGLMDVLGRTKPVKCWKSQGHGSQTLTQAMQHSCNVALVNIGLKIGGDRYYDYLEAFGFFDKTGIDLPGESKPLWWTRKEFANPKNMSSLAATAFGQTFTITPIQLVTAVSAVVNGGNLMEPYVVRQIADAGGNVVLANEPTVVRQVISAQTSETMCEILEQVVGGKEGTGKNAAVPGYKVGGKTGTSVDTTQEATTGTRRYAVSFCGIAPMDDPQIVILVILDNPTDKSGVYISGGNMAAPVVGRILSEVLPYLGVQPVYTDEEKANLDVPVPKLIDKSVEEAKQLLKKQGFTVRLVGDGDTVTAQLPSPNIAVAPGSQVILYAGAEKPSHMITVPELYGKSFQDAKKALEDAGLFLKSGGTLSSTATAVVSTQSAKKGEQVPAGSVVEVVLVDKSIIGHY
ncbi:MAG: PASTA domain-containing protein [Clostridiales bacterium]|nr:PASTA domain-containing protein [Clostridiales bacterium]